MYMDGPSLARYSDRYIHQNLLLWHVLNANYTEVVMDIRPTVGSKQPNIDAISRLLNPKEVSFAYLGPLKMYQPFKP